MVRRRILTDAWLSHGSTTAETITLGMYSEYGGSTAKTGTNQVVALQMSGPWEVTSKPSWITLSVTGGTGSYVPTITVSADAAPTIADRNGQVVIKSISGLLTLIINVSQEGIQDYVRYTADKTISKSLSKPWYTSNITYAVDSIYGWKQLNVVNLTLSPTGVTGGGSNNVTFAWTYNPSSASTKSCSVTLMTNHPISNQKATMSITLAKRSAIKIALGTVSYDFDGGSGILYVTANTPYTLSAPNGITFANGTRTYTSTTTGTGMQVSYTVAVAPNTSDRTLTVTGTTNDYSETADSWGVSTSSLSQRGSQYITFNPTTAGTSDSSAREMTTSLSSNRGWVASSNQTWATIATTAGTGNLASFKVSLTKNNSITDARTATITATTDSGASATYKVTQTFTDPSISISLNKTAFTYPAGSATITVSSNDSWTISSNQTWATLSTTTGTGNGTVTVTYEKNAEPVSRSVTFTAKTNNKTNAGSQATDTATASQSGFTWVNFSPNSASINATDTAVTTTVNSTSAWELTSYNSLTPNKTNGVSGDRVTFTLNKNTSVVAKSFSAAAKLSNDANITSTYSISQAGVAAYFNISPTTATINATGGSFTLTVDSNVKWTITCPNGVTASETNHTTRDSGKVNVTITVDATTVVGTATDTFVVTASTNDPSYIAATSKTCTITRKRVTPSVTISETSLSFGVNGGTKSITVVANTPWSLSTSNSAFILGATAGNAGTTSVQISVSKNYTTSDRTGTLTAKGSTFTAYSDTCSLTQTKFTPSISFSADELTFNTDAGSEQKVTLTTNVDNSSYGAWTISNNNSGAFSVSPTAGTSSSVTITVKTLSANNSPTAYITGKLTGKLTTYSTTDTVDLSQGPKGPYIVLTSDKQTVSSDGGDVTITIESNTDWSLYSGSTSGTKLKNGTSGVSTYTYTIQPTTSTANTTYTFIGTCTNGSNYTLYVSRTGAEEYITVSPTSIAAATGGGSTTITVSTNGGSWTATDNMNWLSLNTTDSTGTTTTASYDATFSTSPRSGTITFTSKNGKKATVSVSQAKTTWTPYLSLAFANSSYSAGATQAKINYTANTSFSLKKTAGGTATLDKSSVSITQSISNSTGSVTMTLTPKKDLSDTTITVTGTTDAITGFNADTATTSTTHKAYSPYIYLTPTATTYTYGKGGDSATWTVSASDAYSVTSYPSTSSSGVTSNKYTFTQNATTSTSVNNLGKFTVALNDYTSYTDSVTLSQEAGTTSSTPFDITVTATQATDGKWSFTYSSDYNLLASYGAKYSLNGNVKTLTGTSGTFSNVTTTNLGTEPTVASTGASWYSWSSGVKTIYTGTITDSLTTTSFTPTLAIDVTDTAIAGTATTTSVSVTSNTSWTISCNGTSYTGSGNATKTITVPQNYTSGKQTTARTWTVLGTTSYGLGVTEATDSDTFTQNGVDDRISNASITLTPSSDSIASSTTAFTLSVDVTPATAPWKVSYGTNTNIKSVTPTTGTGDGTVIVSVGIPLISQTYNFTGVTTYGTDVASSNGSDTCSVTHNQESPQLSITTSTTGVSSAAGSFYLDIEVKPSIVPWTARAMTSGITNMSFLSDEGDLQEGTTISGIGDQRIRVYYSENSSTLISPFAITDTPIINISTRDLTVGVTVNDGGLYFEDEVTVVQQSGKGSVSPTGDTAITVTQYGVKLYFKDSTNRTGVLRKGYAGQIDSTTGSAAYTFTWTSASSTNYTLVAEQSPISSSASYIYIGVWENEGNARTTYFFNASGTRLFTTDGSDTYSIKWSSINATAVQEGTIMWKTIYAHMSGTAL